MTTFQKGVRRFLTYPLMVLPVNEPDITSPRIGANPYNIPRPTFPGETGFDEELNEAMQVFQDVQENYWPSWFFEKYGINPAVPEPLLTHVNPNQPMTAADLVRMDNPIDLGLELFSWLLDWEDLKPKGAKPWNEFIQDRVVLHADLAAYLVEALEATFEVKYFFGRPRPEEANLIGESSTAYPEGCPTHPAYPAGHGAVAGATYAYMKFRFDLSAEQEQVIEEATKHFSMYRSLAMVHYANDNMVGWALGNKVVEELCLAKQAQEAESQDTQEAPTSTSRRNIAIVSPDDVRFYNNRGDMTSQNPF